MRLSTSHPHPQVGCRRRQSRGFSTWDGLATAAVLTLLGVVAFGLVTRASARQAELVCVDNLGKVAGSIHKYAADHQQTLPGPVAGQQGDFWWFYKEQVKSHLGLNGTSSASDTVFACPSDRGYSDPKPFSQTARFDFSSYVFNGVTLPGTPNVAGWKVGAITQPARTLLVMEWAAHAPLSWHRSRTGKANAPFYTDAACAVAFVDGHAAVTPIYYDGFNAAYTRDPLPRYAYRYSGADPVHE